MRAGGSCGEVSGKEGRGTKGERTGTGEVSRNNKKGVEGRGETGQEKVGQQLGTKNGGRGGLSECGRGGRAKEESKISGTRVKKVTKGKQGRYEECL